MDRTTNQKMKTCSKYLEYKFMLHQMEKDSGLPLTQRTIAKFQVERLTSFYYNNCVEENIPLFKK